jgi:hypothetical protein
MEQLEKVLLGHMLYLLLVGFCFTLLLCACARAHREVGWTSRLAPYQGYDRLPSYQDAEEQTTYHYQGREGPRPSFYQGGDDPPSYQKLFLSDPPPQYRDLTPE